MHSSTRVADVCKIHSTRHFWPPGAVCPMRTGCTAAHLLPLPIMHAVLRCTTLARAICMLSGTKRDAESSHREPTQAMQSVDGVPLPPNIRCSARVGDGGILGTGDNVATALRISKHTNLLLACNRSRESLLKYRVIQPAQGQHRHNSS